MDDARMMRVAGTLGRLGAGRISRAVRRGPELRIALTHFVDAGRMDDYRRIVEQLLEDRTPVDPAAVLDGKRAWTGAAPALAFTFDDGLLSSYAAAQKVLNPLGIKAMFFIPTQILGMGDVDEMRSFFAQRVYRRASHAMPDERFVTMTTDHMLELQSQGHVVLPHTHTHIALDQIRTEADVARELVEPKERLEELLQRPCDGFAFPFGNEQVVAGYAYEQVRRVYRVTFTGLNGANTPRTPPDSLYRDCMHPHFPLDYVRDLSSGALDAVYAVKMQRLRRRAAVPA